jgi:phosphate transport system substrate-binding protein
MFTKIILAALLICSVQSYAAVKVTGAGSTFIYPILSKWISEYEKKDANSQFNYQSIGSGGGVKQFIDKTIDFGATDDFMKDDEIAKFGAAVWHLPVTMGAVTVAYNVKGLSQLKLDSQVLGDIFLGKITRWDDAAIKKLNPKAALPATEILVVRRADGSGTTAVFTSFLAATHAEFLEKVGKGKSVNWPVGIGAKGNEGVTAMISQTENAIGYIELAYALNNKLNTAMIKNANGEFIAPTEEAVTLAANALGDADYKGDLRVTIVNAKGKGAYPISALSWLIVTPKPGDEKYESLKKFVSWVITDGQKMSKELHYAPLAKKLTSAVQAKIK